MTVERQHHESNHGLNIPATKRAATIAPAHPTFSLPTPDFESWLHEVIEAIL